MGLRSWWRGQWGRSSDAQVKLPSINLVVGESQPVQMEPPRQAGVPVTPVFKPWSVSRLGAIFRTVQRHPSPSSLSEARLARHCLSSYWLGAPVDLLESLYGGSVGDLQRQQLEGPLPHQPLAADEQQWCEALQGSLDSPEHQTHYLNILLALMPYQPPGQLLVPDALTRLPNWLLRDYVAYCQPELKVELEGPAGLLTPVADAAAKAAEWVPLTSRRGQEALEWFDSEEALNRMQALLNLYALDPSDPQTIDELAVLRRVTAQLWLDVDPEQLQTLYQTPVGILTRGLVTSGFGAVVQDASDRHARALLPTMADDLSAPKALNALLALILFFPPGQVTVNQAGLLPEWLRDELSSF